jgi:putative ABC transport system permease protein
MFKNHLKIAIRNLLKQKVFSFINIAGLAIGMACCILIFLYVQDELKFDQYHENKHRIYRLINKATK